MNPNKRIRRIIIISTVLIIMLFPVWLLADIIPVGSGSYTTVLPAGANPPQNQAGATAYPAVTENISAPIPTTDWWSSIVFKFQTGNQYSETTIAHPFMMKCHGQGLGLGTTFTPVTNPPWFDTYLYPYTEEFVVGVEGLYSPNTLVDDYGDWTVTPKWESGGNSLEATFGHGSPYVYFSKTGGDAKFNFIGPPVVWYNQNGVLGISINGHHYGIFAPTGSTWNINGSILLSDLNGNDYFSVAALPDDSVVTLEYYKSHAYAFVVDTEVSWNYNESSSTLTSTYAATTEVKEGIEDQTLMALYRHQWLHTSAPMTDYSYASSRG